MKPQLIAYCLDWHINFSNAFYELLVVPLRPYSEIQLTAWSGKSESLQENWKQRSQSTPTIFCQRPPSPEILEISDARLVWFPMWDNVLLNWLSDEWWRSLPKSLRVIAFSDFVARKSEAAGLPTLRLRYFKDPSGFNPVKRDNGKKLMYWNRTGLFGPAFLKKLCATLEVSELYFRGTPDPKTADQAAYNLPAKIGRTTVHEITRLKSQTDYFGLLERCSIYLSPRALEGVGLTFLEAMASGCAVLGYDAPTMNEYIVHGENGYLFPESSLKKTSESPVGRLRHIFDTKIKRKNSDTSTQKTFYRVSEHQNWDDLAQMDLEMFGRVAREEQAMGFALWTKQIEDYANFILDW